MAPWQHRRHRSRPRCSRRHPRAPVDIPKLPGNSIILKRFQQSNFCQTPPQPPPPPPHQVYQGARCHGWSPSIAGATGAQVGHHAGATGSGKLPPARRAWRGRGGGAVGAGQAGLGTGSRRLRDGMARRAPRPRGAVRTQHINTRKPFPKAPVGSSSRCRPPRLATSPTPLPMDHSGTPTADAGDRRGERGASGSIPRSSIPHNTLGKPQT